MEIVNEGLSLQAGTCCCLPPAAPRPTQSSLALSLLLLLRQVPNLLPLLLLPLLQLCCPRRDPLKKRLEWNTQKKKEEVTQLIVMDLDDFWRWEGGINDNARGMASQSAYHQCLDSISSHENMQTRAFGHKLLIHAYMSVLRTCIFVVCNDKYE